MKERPILFSAPMVRAILDGRKSQTRRIVKPQPADRCFDATWNAQKAHPDMPTYPGFKFLDDNGRTYGKLCPHGKVGDHLWVREAHAYVGPGSGSDLPSYREERLDPANHKPEHCWYRADGEQEIVWTPGIHMFRGLSRITLEVTGVRVERLNAISEADAVAEGCAGGAAVDPSEEYAALWNSINGRGSWDANPLVWCIEFRRL